MEMMPMKYTRRLLCLLLTAIAVPAIASDAAAAEEKGIDERDWTPYRVIAVVMIKSGNFLHAIEDTSRLFIQYLDSVAAARIPEGDPDGKREVHCLPLAAKDGYLYGADIKNPVHEPARYEEYAGDKRLAFWAPDANLSRRRLPLAAGRSSKRLPPNTTASILTSTSTGASTYPCARPMFKPAWLNRLPFVRSRNRPLPIGGESLVNNLAVWWPMMRS
jgi:hypothetical protein